MTSLKSYLGFTLSGRNHGIPMEAVAELHFLPFLQPTEGNTGALLGYFNFRGETVPVLDLTHLLGLPGLPIHSEDVLLLFMSPSGGGLCGLVAQAVDGFIEFEPDDLKEPQVDPGAEDRPPFVFALGRKGEALYHLLDLEQLVAAARTQGPADRYDSLFLGLEADLESRLRLRSAEGLCLGVGSENLQHTCVEMRLGGETFAVPLAHIREVLPFPPLFPVPGAPPAILGLVNHRGEPLLVVDLRPLLNLPQTGLMPDSRLLVVEDGADSLGLYAEEAGEVVGVPPEQVHPHNSQAEHSVIRGEWLDRDRLLSMIDLEALLEHPDLKIRESEPS